MHKYIWYWPIYLSHCPFAQYFAHTTDLVEPFQSIWLNYRGVDVQVITHWVVATWELSNTYNNVLINLISSLYKEIHESPNLLIFWHAIGMTLDKNINLLFGSTVDWLVGPHTSPDRNLSTMIGWLDNFVQTFVVQRMYLNDLDPLIFPLMPSQCLHFWLYNHQMQ